MAMAQQQRLLEFAAREPTDRSPRFHDANHKTLNSR